MNEHEELRQLRRRSRVAVFLRLAIGGWLGLGCIFPLWFFGGWLVQGAQVGGGWSAENAHEVVFALLMTASIIAGLCTLVGTAGTAVERYEQNKD